MQNDRLGIRLDGLCVNPIGKPFLDNNRVIVVGLRLCQEITNGHGFPCAAHTEEDGVLRRLIALFPGECFDAHQIAGTAVVDRFGSGKMSRERRVHGQHIGEVLVLGVEFPVRVFPPKPSGPRLVKQLPGRRRKAALKVLGAVHRVDCAFDGHGFRNQTGLRLVPNPDNEMCVEGECVSVGQRLDFALLLLHSRLERQLSFAREIPGNPLVRLFFFGDLAPHRQRIDVYRDRVIQQSQIGKPVNNSRERHLGPAREDDYRVIKPVHPKAKVGPCGTFAVPAIFLNGPLFIEGLACVVIEAFRIRRIQETCVMPVMVSVRHRFDSGTLPAKGRD